LDQIKYFWETKKYNKKPSNSLMKSVLRANICKIKQLFFLGSIFIQLFFSFLITALEITSVLLIKMFIEYFQEPNKSQFSLLQLGISLIVNKVLSVFLSRQYYMKQSLLGLHAFLQLSTLVYDKVLRVSSASQNKKSTQGEIVNFIQVDSPKLTNMIQMCPMLFIQPMQIAIYIYMLFKFFNLPFLSGFIILLIFIFINFRMFAKYIVYQKALLERKDARMKLTTETFDHLKLLKLFNWEGEFENRVFLYLFFI
jgi:ABC-type multidrug transport system fused ATPase/permease subunit